MPTKRPLRSSASQSLLDTGSGSWSPRLTRATVVQIMVTDSKKYAATGGCGVRAIRWGKPVDQARLKACFSCHAAKVKGHDLVFGLCALRPLKVEGAPAKVVTSREPRDTKDNKFSQ